MSYAKRNLIRGVVALVCVGLTFFGTIAATNHAGKVSVTAVMADATPLRNGNYVRAAGVQVGTIESVTLDAQGRALVRMSVDTNLLPLHQDATATLVPQDLLGERFVALEPGTASAPEMTEPYTIPLERTKTAVDLRNVVDMVDNPTGTSLAMMLTTLGEGVGRNPKETADAIAALAPAMRDTQQLARVLSDQNQLLSRLVRTAQPVAEAAATQRGASMDRLVGATTATLKVTAANRQQVQDSLRQLPATLLSARRTLAEVAGVAPPTTENLRSLRPLTDDLTDVSVELRRFSEAADPALASLRPVLDKGKTLIDELRPVIGDLREGGGGLRDVSGSYRKLAEDGLSLRLVDLMEFMKGWSLCITDYDALGHYFRDILPYTPKLLGQTGAGMVPGAPNPVPTLPLPKSGRPPMPLGNAEGAPPEEYPPPRLPNNVTGLSPGQENSMMDQLLGGGER